MAPSSRPGFSKKLLNEGLLLLMETCQARGEGGLPLVFYESSLLLRPPRQVRHSRGSQLPGRGSHALHTLLGAPRRLVIGLANLSASCHWLLVPGSLFASPTVSSRTHVGAPRADWLARPANHRRERNFHSSPGCEADLRWSEQSGVPPLLLSFFL